MGRLSKRVTEMQQADRQSSPQPTDKLQEILSREHKGKLGVISDIKENPIPVDVATEIIGGVPMDWHDLENFVASISPTKFVNLLKLQKQMIKDYGIRFKEQRKGVSGRIIILILLAVGLAVAGIGIIMFMPQIMEMFRGGM